MSTDDPRSKELLEEAGDAYAEAVHALSMVDDEAVGFLRIETVPDLEEEVPGIASVPDDSQKDQPPAAA